MERKAKEKSFKTEFQKAEMQWERDSDARVSNKLGQRCQMPLTMMYFTDLSRITLLSAIVENKLYQKEKIILYITEQKNQTACNSQSKIYAESCPFGCNIVHCHC